MTSALLGTDSFDDMRAIQQSGDLLIFRRRDDVGRVFDPKHVALLHFEGFGDRPQFADVLPLARLITDDYLAGTYNKVDIVFSQFVSTLSQRPAIDELPVEQGSPGTTLAPWLYV